METITTQASADLGLTNQLRSESKSATVRNWAYGSAAVIAAAFFGTAACLYAWREPVPATTLDVDALRIMLESLPPLKVDPVKVETVLTAPAPVLPNVNTASTADQTKAIATKVTVFKTVRVDQHNEVVTGWEFPDGSATRPQRQYCYHESDNSDGTQTTTVLYSGNSPDAKAQARFGGEYDNLVAKCQWFKGYNL